MIMLIYPLGDTGGAERFGTGNARIKNFLRFLLSIFDPCSSTPDRTNRPIRNFAARGIACVAFSPSSSPVEKPCNSIISTDTHRSIHGVSIRNGFARFFDERSILLLPPPPLLGPYLDPFRHVWSARQVIGSALVYIYRCRDSPRHLQRNRICFAAYSRGGGRGWMVIRSSFRGENSRRRGERGSRNEFII